MLTGNSRLVGQHRNAADEAAIKRMIKETADAFNNKNAHRVVELATPDVDQNHGDKIYHLDDAGLKEDFSSAPNMTRTYTVQRVRFIRPDVAMVDVRADLQIGTEQSASHLGFIVVNNDGKWVTAAVRGTRLSPDDLAADSQMQKKK